MSNVEYTSGLTERAISTKLSENVKVGKGSEQFMTWF